MAGSLILIQKPLDLWTALVQEMVNPHYAETNKNTFFETSDYFSILFMCEINF